MLVQVKALQERPTGYPKRVPVVLGTTWEAIDRLNYHPADYTSAEILAGQWNPDPEDPHQVGGYPNFRSYEGTVHLDKDGRPLNPMGPTGLRGRGDLSKWGANYAADPIVTRISKDGILELIVVKRSDNGQWAIPGGMVNPGERVTATLKRELGEETAVNLDFTNARAVYQGGVDDRRNTDNAWIETDAYHLHIPKGTNFDFQPQEGEALAVRWMPVSEFELDSLYANHGDLVRLAVQDWEKQTGLVVDKKGRIKSL